MLPTIPLDAIQERARQARPGRALLTAIVLVPWLIGWLLRKAWVGALILVNAASVGWRDAGGGEREHDREHGGQQPGGWA